MNESLKILSGSAHPTLARLIAQNLGIELCAAELTTFPDGETFVQIHENIRGGDIFIVQPTCPPTNQNLMELLIMVDAVRRASAQRITAVLPFFGYARQDRKDRPRVPITAKLVANLLVAAGVHRVLTVDLHAGQIQGFFDIPVDHLYAAPVLMKAIRERGIDGDLVVVSPDVGGIKMTHAFAKALKAPMAIVAKNRVSAEEVEAHSVIGDVKGKNVLLVDDLTETAGTLTAAAKLLLEHGAQKIYAGVSHAVLGEKGKARIAQSPIVELLATNSTPQAVGEKVTALDISPLLAQAIARIHGNESVTSLFDIRS
ncbi:MAG: ribose-phosphate pyrophosphokinase [Verrucomicrobiaceae bacterium]|jgi:ribose-phosphate pyrophosphokinase|nr:ribose-phosphate pyrophosphokinase [Verrucomicrobiaceae bacterium]